MAAGAVAFPMMAAAWCDALQAEMANYRGCGMPLVQPNTMNAHGLILGELGLGLVLSVLLRDVVRPLAAVVFGGAAVRDLHDQYRCGRRWASESGRRRHARADVSRRPVGRRAVRCSELQQSREGGVWPPA